VNAAASIHGWQLAELICELLLALLSFECLLTVLLGRSFAQPRTRGSIRSIEVTRKRLVPRNWRVATVTGA